MTYRIKNTLIPIPISHRGPLLTTLEEYDKGKDLTNSPLIKSKVNLTHADVYFREDKEVALQERQKALIALYENIKSNGYNGSSILAWFDDEGNIHLYDGYHRLAIMEYLGLVTNVNVETEWSGIDGSVGKDFPLAEVLREEQPKGEWLYQPVFDKRVRNWQVERHDSPQRLDYILQNLIGKTVLDIGCSEGYFSRELAKRGYEVTAIDTRKNLIAAAQYLTILSGLNVDYYVADWRNYIKSNGCFDNILFLSVVHNNMKFEGVEKCLRDLETFEGKVSRLFFEVPNNTNERQWMIGQWPKFDFHKERNRLEILTGMKVQGSYSTMRTTFLFGDGRVVGGKSSVKEEKLLLEPDINGYPMYLFKDEMWITPRLIKYHEYEARNTAFVKKQLKSGQTFVDAGANVGYYTILASKIVGDNGRVFAFEPSTSNFEVLIKNIQLNKCSNVIAINKALLDKTGRSKLYKMFLNSHGQLYLQEGLAEDKPLSDQKYGPKDVLAKNDYEEVETIRLDEVLSTPPDMVKVDAEGSEMFAIKGMDKLLSKSSDMVILIEDLTGKAIKYLIDSFGFTLVEKPDRWNHILIRTQQPWWSLDSFLIPQRAHYKPLFDTLRTGQYRNIMEVGTHSGEMAIVMIKAAAQKVPEEEIHYFGFDLFEDMTPQLNKEEFGFMTRLAPTMDSVKARIEKATKVKVTLFKGNTRKTLREAIKTLPEMDLIFIDGGHTTETTKNDWKYSSKLMHKGTIVYFDDYCDEMPFIGAKCITDNLAPKYSAEVMQPANYYPRPFGRLKSQLLKVEVKDMIIKKVESNTSHFRFHLLGLAHSKTTKDWVMCPFTQLTYKMSQMLIGMGHEVYHYGTEGSNPPCTEQVNVLTDAVQKQAYGDWNVKKQLWIHNGGDLAYTTFRKNAIEEIKLRQQPKDLLLISIGNWYKSIADALPGMPAIEPYVGYLGCFSKYKVFPSYAWMHHMYGQMIKSQKENFAMGNWYDAVIPHYFNPEDFKFCSEKEDYFLYIGRFITRKGVHVASQVCKAAGVKLVASGQLLYPDKKEECLHQLGLDQPHIEYLEPVSREKRNELMGKARAVFVPSLYLEPFGKVVIEALLCGTPVITTDWGSFPELVKHGEVGYRCRTMDDFLFAVRNIDKIDPKRCREYSEVNYSMERISLMYQEYFTKVHDLFDKGWYQEHPERKELDWLRKY